MQSARNRRACPLPGDDMKKRLAAILLILALALAAAAACTVNGVRKGDDGDGI